jgi:predicted nucleic acid-binding Zn ribbon protein
MAKCKICSKEISGRSDKKFCSTKCKNYYHVNFRRATAVEVKKLIKNYIVIAPFYSKYLVNENAK